MGAGPMVAMTRKKRSVFAAVAAGDVDAARALLNKPGVDVDAYDADGATLMYIAAAHGHTAMVELLADEGGADIRKSTPPDCKALLVTHWILDPPPQEERDAANGGACPLHIASQEERDAANGGACPLHIASLNGRLGTVRSLVERGADVNQLTSQGYTPLLATVYGGDAEEEAVVFLLENGGDANCANNDGATPVLVASMTG